MVFVGRLEGIGVHTGLHSEIIFYTSDKYNGFFIKHKNDLFNYFDCKLEGKTGQTNLIFPNGNLIKGVEHLLSSVITCNPKSLIIEIKGEEVPIMDGSSIMFFNIIDKLPKNDYKLIEIKEEIIIEKDNRKIVFSPSSRPFITIKGKTYLFTPEFVKRQILPARTYGNMDFYKFMKKYELAKGSSLSNALLITDDGFYNDPRFPDEPQRHKILDFIGDVVPFSYWIKGSIKIENGGHSLFEECRRYIKSLI